MIGELLCIYILIAMYIVLSVVAWALNSFAVWLFTAALLLAIFVLTYRFMGDIHYE